MDKIILLVVLEIMLVIMLSVGTVDTTASVIISFSVKALLVESISGSLKVLN